MKINLLIILITLYAFPCYGQDIKLPCAIKHEGKLYLRDPHLGEHEQIVKHDVDGDGQEEFIARVKGEPQDAPARAFTVIYKLTSNKLVPVKTIIGGDSPSEINFFDIDGDKIDEIIAYDHSGNHYATIMVYSFKNNGYKCLFKNGTACYVCELKTDASPIRIIIGRENWEDKEFCYANSSEKSLLEVWIWDGKQFVYSAQSSTTPAISEEEALEINWQNHKKTIAKIEKGSKETGVYFQEDAGKFLLGSFNLGAMLEDFRKKQ
ncbi:MAG: hypothetical protein PHQ96_09025 [Candidatus Omnitrophica bacterium]|nr:hypothetical protein [Candidatus Omnitrophota bacterium]